MKSYLGLKEQYHKHLYTAFYVKDDCAEYEHLQNVLYQSWSMKKGLHKFEYTYESNQENAQISKF